MTEKDQKTRQKSHFSTTELAQLLGVSRIAVFKKIKAGQISAERIGKNYIVPRSEYERIIGLFVPERRKREIDASVKKTISEYGEALRRLGDE